MNINLLSKLLRELILREDEVCLPGLGTFVSEIMPATFSDKGYAMNPPYRRLVFRKKLDSQDDSLVRLYAEANGIDYKSALRIVEQYVAALDEELRSNKSVTLSGLGKLRATRENNFFFVPDPDQDIWPDGFGLETISLKTHTETKDEIGGALEGFASIINPTAPSHGNDISRESNSAAVANVKDEQQDALPNKLQDTKLDNQINAAPEDGSVQESSLPLHSDNTGNTGLEDSTVSEVSYDSADSSTAALQGGIPEQDSAQGEDLPTDVDDTGNPASEEDAVADNKTDVTTSVEVPEVNELSAEAIDAASAGDEGTGAPLDDTIALGECVGTHFDDTATTLEYMAVAPENTSTAVQDDPSASMPAQDIPSASISTKDSPSAPTSPRNSLSAPTQGSPSISAQEGTTSAPTSAKDDHPEQGEFKEKAPTKSLRWGRVLLFILAAAVLLAVVFLRLSVLAPSIADKLLYNEEQIETIRQFNELFPSGR